MIVLASLAVAVQTVKTVTASVLSAQLLCSGSMSCVLQLARPSRVPRVFYGVRWNSTQAIPHQNTPPAPPASSSVVKSQKRPHLGIKVDPNHGLWAFFRKKEVDGVVKHETLEARESLTESGACHLGCIHVARADSLWTGRTTLACCRAQAEELQGLAYALVCSLA